MSIYSYRAIVRNVINNSEFSATFQSVYANPAHAVAAYEDLNKNRLQVIELRATLTAPSTDTEDAPTATPYAPLAETPAAAPEASDELWECVTLLDDTVSITTDTGSKTLSIQAEYDKGRCELYVVYTLNSRTSYEVKLVANSLQEANLLTYTLTMHGHRSAALRQLLSYAALQERVSAGFTK